jgi:hypothetical protein
MAVLILRLAFMRVKMLLAKIWKRIYCRLINVRFLFFFYNVIRIVLIVYIVIGLIGIHMMSFI